MPPAVLIVGDHGMADGGGHGGATLQEVLVPLVVLSPAFDIQVQFSYYLPMADGGATPRGSGTFSSFISSF